MKDKISNIYKMFLGYSQSKDNPHQVTCEQVKSMTRENILLLLNGLHKNNFLPITNIELSEDQIEATVGKGSFVIKDFKGYYFGRYFEYERFTLFGPQTGNGTFYCYITLDSNGELTFESFSSAIKDPKDDYSILLVTIRKNEMSYYVSHKLAFNKFMGIGNKNLSNTRIQNGIPFSDEKGEIKW